MRRNFLGLPIDAFLGQFCRRVVSRQLVTNPSLKVERIGSKYGGWIIPVSLIKDNWICYCGGVGEDATFDLELIRRFGCKVFAFDPTPRAIAYAEEQSVKDPRFKFFPFGLWSSDRELRFYSPQNPDHVSHSVVNLQETETFFVANCRRIASLMSELGHPRLDLLKIDIEGAEHEVIRSMFKEGVMPRVLCVEIDQPVSALQFAGTMARIFRSGYELVAVDGWNFTFLRAQVAS